MAGADLQDVAASGKAVLKVNGQSKPNSVAGAICNVVRESPNGNPPNVLATGPAAINQAIKAIAVAKKYLLLEKTPIDLLVTPCFEQARRSPLCPARAAAAPHCETPKRRELILPPGATQDVRNGSNLVLELKRCAPIDREPSDDDLSATEKTDCFKLAGAIAGRIRDGEQARPPPRRERMIVRAPLRSPAGTGALRTRPLPSRRWRAPPRARSPSSSPSRPSRSRRQAHTFAQTCGTLAHGCPTSPIF